MEHFLGSTYFENLSQYYFLSRCYVANDERHQFSNSEIAISGDSSKFRVKKIKASEVITTLVNASDT